MRMLFHKTQQNKLILMVMESEIILMHSLMIPMRASIPMEMGSVMVKMLVRGQMMPLISIVMAYPMTATQTMIMMVLPM